MQLDIEPRSWLSWKVSTVIADHVRLWLKKEDFCISQSLISWSALLYRLASMVHFLLSRPLFPFKTFSSSS